MGWEDIAIGVGQGISQGVQNAGAIQKVWADKAAMDTEAKMAPIRLEMATNQRDMSNYQLADEKRKQEMLGRPYDYKTSELYKRSTPDMQKIADDVFKDLPPTYAGAQEGLDRLTKNTAIMEGMEKVTQQTGMARYQAKLAEANTTQDPALKAKHLEDAKEILKSTQSAKEQISMHIEQTKAKEAYNSLSAEDKKKMEPFLNSPKDFWTGLLKLKNPDMNKNFIELLYEKHGGDAEAAANEYKKFEKEKVRLIHDGADKPRKITETDVRGVERQLGQVFISRPGIAGTPLAKKIKYAMENNIPVYSVLDTPERMNEFKEMQREALDLFGNKRVNDSTSAVLMVEQSRRGQPQPKGFNPDMGLGIFSNIDRGGSSASTKETPTSATSVGAKPYDKYRTTKTPATTQTTPAKKTATGMPSKDNMFRNPSPNEVNRDVDSQIAEEGRILNPEVAASETKRLTEYYSRIPNMRQVDAASRAKREVLFMIQQANERIKSLESQRQK